MLAKMDADVERQGRRSPLSADDEDVLHGDSASNAATVSFWAGGSYLMPVIGAAIADIYWGKYKTVLVGLSISFVGMAVITTSATLSSLRPPPCEQSARCAPATPSQRLVFFTGIYLCAIGIGGAKAAIVSFGAEQFDDDNGENAAERERKASYFSWYYAVSNLGMLTAGSLLVWVEDRVSWGLGYGVCASFVAVAVVGLAVTAPVYRIVPPVGSPLKGMCQVLVAFTHKVKLRVPEDAAELYDEEHVKTPLLEPVRERLEHTDQFRCLDKAAVVTAGDLEDGNQWRLCTVTQVEELKTLLRLIPIWLTSAVYFIANSQAQTTFVQQGTKTDSRIARGAFSVPAASLTCIETVFVAAYIALYNKSIAPAARRCLGRADAFTPLQLMGLGHAAVTAAVVVAACTEARRLEAARARSTPMSIAWLLPQYVVMAVSDASLSVGQLEFFYDQAPETIRGASTAFYFLSCSLGNFLSSQLVTLVASVTAAGGRTGWFPPDMDDGHLDYYFLLVVAITAANFAAFVYLAKNYTPKRVR
ncbi:protein NRT1/ PTR FAMILY 8.5-like isoform X2 [Phragmites australis]|uniref:protein NRT1/ PTR FAMILY 8.5-like isoform X2 n=1 Tax=Phragmites australis TaxID=29695 RepID=UPI002D79C3A2|nr:protein NRT1/ PTR FAMILY 8.5-like isoform X2 [Phragmites australis]